MNVKNMLMMKLHDNLSKILSWTSIKKSFCDLNKFSN